jgi:hypothetical protein
MIARHRGEHDRREPWRPRRAIATAPATAPPPARPPASPQPTDRLLAAAQQEIAAIHAPARPRRTRRLALIVLVLAAVIAGRQLEHPPAASPLPATPRQWVDEFATSILQNPHDVCTRLFAPQLAAAYPTGRHTNCTSFLTHATSTPFGVRRILHDGATAVFELRQRIQGSYWDVVLNRDHSGWRAVDLVGGTTPR